MEDYTTSSYGDTRLADKISNFIDNASDSVKYGDGEIYRGLMFDSKAELDNFVNQHQVGDVIKTRRDGLSWTSDRNVANEFSSNASDYSVVLVNSDTSKNAIGISNIADTPISSKEVLYSNKVDFKVTRVQKQSNTVVMQVTENKRK